MKNVIFSVLLYFVVSFSWAQNLNYYQSNAVKVVADTYYGTDVLGNYYYSNASILYKKTSDKIFSYQNVSLGKISSVDTLNPLLIVVFYADFNSCVLLDNQFNEIKTINFNQLQEPLLLSLLGLSSQNELWFFDTLQQKIGLLNYNTLSYRFISNPIENNIVHYASNYNYFIWFDKLNKLHTLNRFGVINNLENPYPQSHIILGNTDDVIFYDDLKMVYYNLQKKQMQDIYVDNFLGKNLWLKNGILSTFTNQEILTFQIKK